MKISNKNRNGLLPMQYVFLILRLVTYFLQPALERIKNTYCMGKRPFLYLYSYKQKRYAQSSADNTFARYTKLLDAAKDVDKFTKFVVEKYDKLRRRLESSCDVQPSGDCNTDTHQQSKTCVRLDLIYT